MLRLQVFVTKVLTKSNKYNFSGILVHKSKVIYVHCSNSHNNHKIYMCLIFPFAIPTLGL